ncbi:CBF/Mak21 family-domain-containing protein [Massariosphaeria phaeospora]|uniref:CBF/Mak21 family-domain-containing protein n=1 Tax=Massariosphaeria phaeospora TaxID=100035 RepID=A0A7C8M5S9_9PLEO|nr:CBF/Mak21 family-domain-containing protein [Massariosphaeria phaeospora]
MPGSKATHLAGAKRKRESSKTGRPLTKSKTRRTSPSADGDDPQTEILQLEAQILESRRHYNNIATLLKRAQQQAEKHETAILAAVALCRVFSRLLSTGDMVKSKRMAESELVIVQWLKERHREYLDVLLDQYLRGGYAPKQSVALTLLMRMLKEESKAHKDHTLSNSPLTKLVDIILLLPEDDSTRDEFAEKYFKQFDDVRFHTFLSLKKFLDGDLEAPTKQLASSNSLSLLMSLHSVPTSQEDTQAFFTETHSKNPIPSLKVYKSHAQEAWLATLRAGLTKEQRKAVLGVFSHQIAPWFQQPELVMDFLTDSYNVGGATSLLALSGLYYLISEKNLDYPSFYLKLYSLLDDGLLHSKHRSRFFRLLDTFMSSTHLPAALVASFIKRLSRLALHGPPAGVVVVLPWIYNMFKRHPACTFMMHREIRGPDLEAQLEEEGMDDPFSMDEPDPMLTEAIESSVWELESLQSHYHPNVATLARIVSDQFTKRSYNLEDFLDHSYSALLDTELNRDLKKEPEVEFEIPKRIFTAEGTAFSPLGQLMMQVITTR